MDVLKRIDFVQQFAKEYADGAWSIDVDQWKHHVTPEFIEDIRQYIESLHLKLMYLQTQQAKQRICVGESYEMIDRFLRNNLGDDDYESYSDALCEVAAPQPAQPSEPAQPEYFAQYEYALDFSVLVAVYRRRADQTPELIHKEALPKQIGDGQPAQPEQGELAGPDQIEKIVDRYVDEYEFTDGENAYHSPNEFEQMLIKDAFYGLLVDEEWDAAWGAHIASLQSAQPEQGPST